MSLGPTVLSRTGMRPLYIYILHDIVSALAADCYSARVKTFPNFVTIEFSFFIN